MIVIEGVQQDTDDSIFRTENTFMTVAKIVPVLFVASALFLAPGCSSQQAAYKTNEVTAQTGSTVDSVLDGVGSVIMYPVHLVGDLFS